MTSGVLPGAVVVGAWLPRLPPRRTSATAPATAAATATAAICSRAAGRLRVGPERTQPGDHVRKHTYKALDLGVGRRPPDGHAEAAVGIDAHRLEDRRGLERLGRARAARMRGHASLVEAE